MKFHCPHCNQRIEAGEEVAGQIGECPNCAGKFSVPGPPPGSHPPVQRPRTAPAPQAKSQRGRWVAAGSAMVVVIAAAVGFFAWNRPSATANSSATSPTSAQPLAAELEFARKDGKAVFLWRDTSTPISLSPSPPWRFPVSFVRLKPIAEYSLATEAVRPGDTFGTRDIVTFILYPDGYFPSKPVDPNNTLGDDIRKFSTGTLFAGGRAAREKDAPFSGKGTVKVYVEALTHPPGRGLQRERISNILEIPVSFEAPR